MSVDYLGHAVGIDGSPLVDRAVTLKRSDTLATLGETVTDSAGMWRFDDISPTHIVRAEISAGTTPQIAVKSVWSGDVYSLYVREALTTAPAAVVGFGGPVTMAGALTVDSVLGTGGSFAELTGGNATLSGNLSVDGNSTLNGTVLLGNAAAPAPVLAFTFDPDTGIASPAANQLAIRAGGNDIAVFGSTFVEMFEPLILQDNLSVAGGATFDGQVGILGALTLSSDVGFYGTPAVAKPTVTGSRGSNAALTSLLTALANLGLITNSSS